MVCLWVCVCVYWRGGCCCRRMKLYSVRALLQFAYISSLWSHTSPSLLFSYLLAIKSTFCTLQTDVRGVLMDQPLTSFIYVLLKRCWSYYQQLFILFFGTLSSIYFPVIAPVPLLSPPFCWLFHGLSFIPHLGDTYLVAASHLPFHWEKGRAT